MKASTILLCLAVFLISGWPTVGLAQAKTETTTLQLNNQQEDYALSGFFEQYTDTSAVAGFDDILKLYQSRQFKTLPGFLNLGYTTDVSWITFQFRTPGEIRKRYYLWLAPYMLNTVDVYIQTATHQNQSDQYRLLLTGDHRPALSSPNITPYSLALGDLVPNQTYRVFIRTQTTSTHTLSAWIRSATATIEQHNTHLIVQISFIASTLILGVIAWLQAIRLKNSIQFWYGLYLISVSGIQAGMQGIMPLVFPAWSYLLSDLLAGAMTGSAFLSMAVIISMVLNSKQDHPEYHYYLICLAVLSILAILTAKTHLYPYVMVILAPGSIAMVPLACWLYFRKFSWHDPSQRFFFLFFLICSVGISIHLLRLSGIVPVNNLTSIAMTLNTLIHMVLLNLALSEKLLDAEQKARCAAEASEGKAVALAEEMTKELLISKEQLEIALSKEQQALKEQGRFIDMISHEYRTPLAIIKTNLDILDLKAQPDWQSDNNLQAMTKATERLQEIFDSELRKDHMGYQITSKMQNIPALEALQQIFTDAQSLWPNNRIQLDNPDYLAHLTMTADPGLLKTLIFNLLDNAQKYSPADQTVKCLLGRCDDLSDTSSGTNTISGKTALQVTISNPVNPADAAHIDIHKLCEKYTRGGNSSGSSGLGLGLYLVQQITQAHHGKLALSLDKDNNFSVRLTLPAIFTKSTCEVIHQNEQSSHG